jgi:pimeloyl-ACP methyl ester carboxylesterase
MASIAILSMTLLDGRPIFPLANALAMCSEKYIPSPLLMHPNVLPVILIHGYNEPPSVWSHWEERLRSDGIPFCTVYYFFGLQFRYDECGSALDHSNDLAQIVQDVKSWTLNDQVNMVGHSKGGLDARVYLAKSGTHDVANLIMIGTPNGGNPLVNELVAVAAAKTANIFLPGFELVINSSCRPALDNLAIGADATKAIENESTKYYTIYGDWNPSLPCPLIEHEDELYKELKRLNQIPNDGIVPVWSVESHAFLPHSAVIGHTQHCQTGLLSDEEYSMAKNKVLMPVK